MADLVNLRQARKARARADAEAVASTNRVKFGRSRAERKREEAERSRAERAIEGHRRDEGEP